MLLSQLHPNEGQIKGVPRNPRQITEKDFEDLKKSLRQFRKMLALRPMVVDEDFNILGGNMRYRALCRLRDEGVKIGAFQFTDEIPDEWVKQDCTMTEKEKREFVTKDNVQKGEWDWDVLANEWDSEELKEWGVAAANWDASDSVDELESVQEDNFDEGKDEVQTICQSGDIWQLGEHRLMCGDSTSADDVVKLMQGEKADLWLTDPPYNVDYSAKNDAVNRYAVGHKDIQNDIMSNTEFLEFLIKAFSNANISMKEGCSFYIWFASREHKNFEGALNHIGLQCRQELIWNKSRIVFGRQDYQWKHEPCLYGWKEGAAHYFIDLRNETTVIEDEAEIDPKKMKKEDLIDLCTRLLEARKTVETSVIHENKPSKSELHPTMKPIRLFARLIRNSSRPNEIVLDTFGGSGTTIIACEQLNRKCYMMELDPHYCDVIIARWEKLTGKTATKIE